MNVFELFQKWDESHRKNFKTENLEPAGITPNWPTKDEVDKLVENHLKNQFVMKCDDGMKIKSSIIPAVIGVDVQKNETSNNIRSYNLRKKKDRQRIEEDFGTGSEIHPALMQHFCSGNLGLPFQSKKMTRTEYRIKRIREWLRKIRRMVFNGKA